ncbi:hypothetical protein [Streptomyces sp. NPDC013740]|uniref:hypothetical protein n=1 Tax=Streptomyces sp. NPDC013740 TaxID=3364867 RepID=UPI0036FE573B
MNSLPPLPTPSPRPAPDPRSRNVAPDFAGMAALLADLTLPSDASMYVMSALETSCELIRYSYYRYEFATVAVTHSLLALEHVLAERLATKAPVQDLIERAAGAGLIPADLAAELDRGRTLRDGLAQGTVTSAALGPVEAITMVHAVFEAMCLLLRPQPAASEAQQPEDPLARLWEEHRGAPYPDGFRGVDVAGVELILLDADVAALVQRELTDALDDHGIAILWTCIADLDKVVPLINAQYCAAYFARLRTMAKLAAARHMPTAT